MSAAIPLATVASPATLFGLMLGSGLGLAVCIGVVLGGLAAAMEGARGFASPALD